MAGRRRRAGSTEQSRSVEPAGGDPRYRNRAGGQTAGRASGKQEAGDRVSGRQLPAERDPGELAREICLRLLAFRPRTRAELAASLAKRGVPEDVAADVLDRYDEVGIIDDQAFARAWVSSRHHGRGLAGRALAGELRRKGVDSSVVDEALDELDPSTEEATARALVARRLRIERGVPEATFRRLVGVLARKGYPPGLAIRLVRDALAERSEMAEFADSLDPDALADAAEPAGAED